MAARRRTSARRSRARKTLTKHLTQRKLLKRVGLPGLIVIVLLVVLLDRAAVYGGGEQQRYESQAWTVVRVVDGDTLVIDAPDVNESGNETQTTRVRLWGIDTPEIANARFKKEAEPFGDEAAAFARRLCEGKQVRLRLESHDLRDKYQRLLAYIELPDGSMLNERLLAAGLAEADDRFSHSLLERFTHLEKQARHDRLGLWGE